MGWLSYSHCDGSTQRDLYINFLIVDGIHTASPGPSITPALEECFSAIEEDYVTNCEQSAKIAGSGRR